MRYIQYYNECREEDSFTEVDPSTGTILKQALASDGVHHIDGRLNMASVHLSAVQQARSLRGVGKNFKAFRVFNGQSYSNARPVTGYYYIED